MNRAQLRNLRGYLRVRPLFPPACTGEQYAGRAVGLYQRRRPAETVLYQLVQEHLERRGV
jgi:hypothetical protein